MKLAARICGFMPYYCEGHHRNTLLSEWSWHFYNSRYFVPIEIAIMRNNLFQVLYLIQNGVDVYEMDGYLIRFAYSCDYLPMNVIKYLRQYLVITDEMIRECRD